MPVDPSIISGIQAPQQPNMLATLAGVQTLKTAGLQQNALAAQIQGNQAQSAAIAGNTDANGNVDWQGATRDLGKNPGGSYNLLPFAQASQGMQKGQVDIDTGSQALAMKKAAAAAQIGVAVLTNPNAGPQDYVNGILAAQQNGQIDGPTASNAIVHASSTFGDPAAFRSYLQNGLASLPPEIQAQYVKPVLGTINTGGGTTMTETNPITGVPKQTGYVPTTLTPTEQMSRISTVGPNGAQGTVPQGSIAPPNLLPPGSSFAGSATGAPATGGAGRYPTQGQPGAAPGAPAAPSGFMPTALPPGVAQAADVAGTASGTQMVADQQANAGSGQRVYQLQSALTGLQGAGPTGPGTATTNQIASFLQAQVPFGLGKYLPGVDPSKIASYDEANKYLTQYAAAKAGAMGGGTDAKLATTLSGNASTHISGLAAQDVVKANIGLERMGQAQQDAFAASGLPASQYTTFASKFGSTIDPRVFIADQMEPAKVATLVQNMNPKQQAQFKAQYNWAVQKGYINGPQ